MHRFRKKRSPGTLFLPRTDLNIKKTTKLSQGKMSFFTPELFKDATGLSLSSEGVIEGQLKEETLVYEFKREEFALKFWDQDKDSLELSGGSKEKANWIEGEKFVYFMKQD